ncbi:hypothetical protein D3C81_273650 [compost metagenome]
MDFSDYIVYVDESGDHTLNGYNENYPVFVLAFCIFHKRYYTETVIHKLEQLKFKHFGHDIIVMHERDILKGTGDFRNYSSKEQKDKLLNDLTTLMQETNFILISCVVRKDLLIKKYATPKNPYFIALEFGLERIYKFLVEKNQQKKKTFIVFEQRGKQEDRDLELEFRRVCDGNNYDKICLPFEIKMASKKVNSSGLQIADLVARPIGNHVLKPLQSNRAFDVLKFKFYSSRGRPGAGVGYTGYGLKVFP